MSKVVNSRKSKVGSRVPGPWVLEDYITTGGHKGTSIVHRHADGDVSEIADLCCDYPDDGRANGAVLTAAPDLLDAALLVARVRQEGCTQAFCVSLGGHYWQAYLEGGISDVMNIVYAELKAAIAKATGGAA